MMVEGQAGMPPHAVLPMHGVLAPVGPAERCIGLAWHPLRGMLLSVSEGGRVYVWAKAYAENWSAFAPGFKAGGGTETCTRKDVCIWQL